MKVSELFELDIIGLYGDSPSYIILACSSMLWALKVVGPEAHLAWLGSLKPRPNSIW